MRNKILAANWKMNLTAPEAHDWLAEFNEIDSEKSSVEFRLYAPSVFLSDLVKSRSLHIGAQNVHPSDFGAFTGEVSIPQLVSVGVQSVLIGHSERRTDFHETDAFLKEKVDACCNHTLPFIFCCGESLEIREKGEHLSFVRAQITAAILHLNHTDLSLLTIAYEPIWAIGTGQTATNDQINEVHAFIRKVLRESFGDDGANVSILYGGSVNPSNAQSIFACPDVDGGLIGGASLNASHFLELASYF
jgi:triosephosphate isomerase